MKYKAFISYSHAADDALAPALQSALHAFARPWSSMRALHVFRDKTSLAASPELWPAIEKALSESEYLLLMASPASAASHWVGREIDWWFANRPKGTLFILLTEGELAWDENAKDFDWSRTTSLPRASLTGRFGGEPLWVDLRWARSDEALSLRHTRFRSAVLDIAAPLHGKDKDALDGEDVQAFSRLQRVRRTVAAGLALLAIVATAAGTIALQARSEAARQGNVAQASRLAAQADVQREEGGAVDESVSLASEALSLLVPLGVRSLEADLSMRRALGGLPMHLGEAMWSGNGDRLNADGTIMFAMGAGDQVNALRLPDAKEVGCNRAAIDSIVAGDSTERVLRLRRAISETAEWCVLQRFDSTLVNTLQLWRSTPTARVAELRMRSQAGHLYPFVSADGDLIATNDVPQTSDRGQIIMRIWSRRLNAEVVRSTGEAFVAFSPDSVHYATTLGLYRLGDADRVPVRRIGWKEDGEPSGFYSGLVFSRTGRYVASRRGYAANVDVWNVDSDQREFETSAPAGSLLAIRDDGRMIVVSSRTTSLVSTRDDVVRATIPQEAKAAAFGAANPTLLVKDTVWSVYGTRVLRMMAFGDAVSGVELPDDEVVQHITFADTEVRALSISDSAMHLRAWSGDSTAWRDVYTADAPRAVAVSADGRTIVASIGTELQLLRMDGSRPFRVLSTVDTASALGISRDGRHVAAWYRDSVHVWAAGAAMTTSVPMAGAPEALLVSSDASYLVAEEIDRKGTSRGGSMHILRRWRLSAPGDSISVEIGRALRDVASLCMVSDDARELVVDGVRRPFVRDTARLAFSERDLTECDVGGAPVRLEQTGARVLALDRGTAQPVARLDYPRPITHAAASRDGKRLVALDEGGEVRIHLLDPAELVAQACARLPRPNARARELSAAVAGKSRDACGREWPSRSTP